MGKRISIENPNQWLLLFVCLLIFFCLFLLPPTTHTHTHTGSYVPAAKKQRCCWTYGYCEINTGPGPERSGCFLFFSHLIHSQHFRLEVCLGFIFCVFLFLFFFFFFCRLGGWIESTSADIVLTGGVVSISQRQLWSEGNEMAVYLSQGPIMCVCEGVTAQGDMCAPVCICLYINVQSAYAKLLFAFCMRVCIHIGACA